VWILATLLLVPLFLVRLLRRSSLISGVLFTIALFMIAMLATFGIRAYISNNAPTTTLMIVRRGPLSMPPASRAEPELIPLPTPCLEQAMNAMLAIMPPLLVRCSRPFKPLAKESSLSDHLASCLRFSLDHSSSLCSTSSASTPSKVKPARACRR
jgi:hypothetical protein